MNSIKSCKNGTFIINTNDLYIGQSLALYGEFSEGECELFRDVIKSGQTVLDIGANIGAHTVLFGKLAGSDGLVMAFEPQRIPYYMLCGNVMINNLCKTVCLQQAVGQKNGSIPVPEIDFSKPGNFGGLELGKGFPPDTGICSVKLIKIDDLNLNQLDFIKIDVEGMEIEVLNGATNKINQYSPIIYVENDREKNCQVLLKTLFDLNYKVYLHVTQLFNENNFLDNKDNIFGSISSYNLFCHHKETACPINLDKHNLREVLVGTEIIPTGTVSEVTIAERRQEMAEETFVSVTHSMANFYIETEKNYQKAQDIIRNAIKIKPHWLFYNQYSTILSRQMKYAETLKFLDLGARFPDHDPVVIQSNRGIALTALKSHEKAIQIYLDLLEKYPNHVPSHFNLAWNYLILGDFKNGLPHWEWRLKMPELQEYTKIANMWEQWDGSPIVGKKILLFGEQGIGDMIQYVRYASKIKEMGGETYLVCSSTTADLFHCTPGIDHVVKLDENGVISDPPKVDYAISLLSLPYIFRTNLDTIPWDGPYIFPVPNFSHSTRILNSTRKFKIGICWAGNHKHKNDFVRSCELKHFMLLNSIDQIQLFSLQKGDMARQWLDKEVYLGKANEYENCIDLSQYINNFNDTAIFIKEMDIIVSVDTSIAHLAAAMGKKVYLLLGEQPDARWLIDRQESPWYPTMKIYRKEPQDDWQSIFLRLVEDIKIILRIHGD